jgi:hypothetical protein
MQEWWQTPAGHSSIDWYHWILPQGMLLLLLLALLLPLLLLLVLAQCMLAVAHCMLLADSTQLQQSEQSERMR